MNRERLLRDGYELVVSTMNLRRPQAEALAELRDALIRLPKPLCHCSDQERREFLACRENWRHPFHPSFTIALATGVGKTRLAGAVIALLWLTGEARTFLILAPRRAVLRRFENALDQRYREYIFVDPNLLPEPSVVRADEIDSPRAFEFQGDLMSQGPKVFLLSPQLIASSDRFQRKPSFSDASPMEALKARRDVVVIADEAHHIGKQSSKETTAWANAIRQLDPALQIGLTATPRGEAGEYLLYEYSLQRALKEGYYTKSVHICVRQFSENAISQLDIDKAAIIYSLDRLDRKVAAISAFDKENFPPTKPICVFFAKDIEHAELVEELVIATGRVRDDEVLLTHSAMTKSDDELERLLSIENFNNPVRVVVNVMELTEGWDVTNVYVVTPLRAMATFTGALQAMGRGLRLPAGERVNNPVLDELDVVCFGREALAKIVTQATDWTGSTEDKSGVKVTEFDKADPVQVLVQVPSSKRNGAIQYKAYSCVEEDLVLELHVEALARVKEAVVTEIELAAAQTRLGFGRPKLNRETFIRAAALRVIRSLGKYLSDAKDYEKVSSLVRSWLDQVKPSVLEVEYDPVEVGAEMAGALEAGARVRPARYELLQNNITIKFPPYTGKQELLLGPGEPLPKIEVADLPVYPKVPFKKGQLYQGWKRGLHVAYAFDSEPEIMLATLMDNAEEVLWWVRNDPCNFRLETPAGQFRPDFVAAIEDGNNVTTLILEAKGDHLWKSPVSEARLKSAAAREWATLQQSAGMRLSVKLALESDIKKWSSWAELFAHLE